MEGRKRSERAHTIICPGATRSGLTRRYAVLDPETAGPRADHDGSSEASFNWQVPEVSALDIPPVLSAAAVSVFGTALLERAGVVQPPPRHLARHLHWLQRQVPNHHAVSAANLGGPPWPVSQHMRTARQHGLEVAMIREDSF
eukprot:2456860-Rhodomonas_salina.2